MTPPRTFLAFESRNSHAKESWHKTSSLGCRFCAAEIAPHNGCSRLTDVKDYRCEELPILRITVVQTQNLPQLHMIFAASLVVSRQYSRAFVA